MATNAYRGRRINIFCSTTFGALAGGRIWGHSLSHWHFSYKMEQVSKMDNRTYRGRHINIFCSTKFGVLAGGHIWGHSLCHWRFSCKDFLSGLR